MKPKNMKFALWFAVAIAAIAMVTVGVVSSANARNDSLLEEKVALISNAEESNGADLSRRPHVVFDEISFKYSQAQSKNYAQRMHDEGRVPFQTPLLIVISVCILAGIAFYGEIRKREAQAGSCA